MQRHRHLHLSHLQSKPERKQGLPKDSGILTGQHLGGEGRQVASNGDLGRRCGQGPAATSPRYLALQPAGPCIFRVQVMCTHMEVWEVLGCRGGELEVQVG